MKQGLCLGPFNQNMVYFLVRLLVCFVLFCFCYFFQINKSLFSSGRYVFSLFVIARNNQPFHFWSVWCNSSEFLIEFVPVDCSNIDYFKNNKSRKPCCKCICDLGTNSNLVNTIIYRKRPRFNSRFFLPKSRLAVVNLGFSFIFVV